MMALLDATLRVSVILLIALALVWLLRKRTASLRHAVLVIALGCAAIVPVLGTFVPPWISPAIVMPQALQQLSVAEGPVPDEALIEPPAIAAESFAPDTQAYATQAATQAAVSAAPTRSGDWRTSLPRILKVVWITYLTGLAIALALLALGLLQLRWMAARSTPLQNDYWQWQASEITDAYGLRRPVHLARSPHPSMLAIWGILRPQVLLPTGAEDWPEDRVRAVLLHELAHIRRGDWIVQVLAGLLRAVYWFNPLVWFACARLRQESEQACDDEVIGRGVTGPEYAAHLLALARTLTRPAKLFAPAPSMAHRSTLRKRIADILDPTVTHTRASRRSVVKTTAIMLAVTWVVAACHVTTPPAQHIETAPLATSTDPAPVATNAATVPATKSVIEVKSRPVSEEVQQIRDAQVMPPAPVFQPEKETPTPQMVAAGILEFVNAALADDTPVPLSQFDGLTKTLGSVQRRARLVIDDDGRNPATLPEKYTGLLNELGYAATGAIGAASRNGPRLSTPRLQQLAVDLRAKATELADVVLPVSSGAPTDVPDPAQTLAITARDIAGTALADTSFIAPRLHTWLTEELGTLQRSARSVLSDDGRNLPAATTKRYALLGSAKSTSKNAFAIADRAGESEATRGKARELATSLRDLALRLTATTRSRAISGASATVHILDRDGLTNDRGESIRVTTNSIDRSEPPDQPWQVWISANVVGPPPPRNAIDNIRLVASDGKEIRCHGGEGDESPPITASGYNSFGTSSGTFRICVLRNLAELSALETVEFTYQGEKYLYRFKP